MNGHLKKILLAHAVIACLGTVVFAQQPRRTPYPLQKGTRSSPLGKQQHREGVGQCAAAEQQVKREVAEINEQEKALEEQHRAQMKALQAKMEQQRAEMKKRMEQEWATFIAGEKQKEEQLQRQKARLRRQLDELERKGARPSNAVQEKALEQQIRQIDAQETVLEQGRAQEKKRLEQEWASFEAAQRREFEQQSQSRKAQLDALQQKKMELFRSAKASCPGKPT